MSAALSEILKYKEWVFRVDRKPKYRSIKLSISTNGTLSILASKSLVYKDIIKFIEQNELWCEKSLSVIINKIKSYPLKLGLEGEEILFLGVPRKIIYKKSEQQMARVFGGQFILESPGFSVKENFNLIRHYYRTESEKILKELIAIRSQEMNLFPRKIIFRNQTSRWGSCSSEGTISLNWKLSMAPLKTMDYVVVHELAHLKYRNHSKRFWDFVTQFVPNHKAHGSWLKKNYNEFDWLETIPQLHCSEIKHTQNNAARPRQKRIWYL